MRTTPIYGSEILYTGAGGNDPRSGRQVRDQELTQPGNAGLVTDQLEGRPVRVVRGASGDPPHSPSSGYRYDGLFRVADHWSEPGRSGFRVWRFRLLTLSADETPPLASDDDAAPAAALPLPPGREAPGSYVGVAVRVARSTAVAEAVKSLYGGACQVCGQVLAVPGGVIAEGAHIRALGRPHHGPDVVDNMLCLCPNHHSLFDAGGITITEDGEVADFRGTVLAILTRHPRHTVAAEHLRYHRHLWAK